MLPDFRNAEHLSGLIDAYFEQIKGEYHLEDAVGAGQDEDDPARKKVWDREPEPVTFSGLAYFLGFSSRAKFKEYGQKGDFSVELNRAHLKIEVVYEKKLHNNQTSTGAIFALKSEGWNEKETDTITVGEGLGTLNVKVIESGPKPAENEHDIVL